MFCTVMGPEIQLRRNRLLAACCKTWQQKLAASSGGARPHEECTLVSASSQLCTVTTNTVPTPLQHMLESPRDSDPCVLGGVGGKASPQYTAQERVSKHHDMQSASLRMIGEWGQTTLLASGTLPGLLAQ